MSDQPLLNINRTGDFIVIISSLENRMEGFRGGFSFLAVKLRQRHFFLP